MPSTLFLKGSSYGKKRKRVPGANHVVKNEVKIVNMASGQTAEDPFDSINVKSMYITSITGSNYGCWYPFKLKWPNTGTAAGNRIGDKIFMKYIRLKGSIGIMNRVLVGIRWRLRFIRCDQKSLSSDYFAGISGYLGLFRGTWSPDFTNPVQWQVECLKCKRNFYQKYANVELSNTTKTKVVASGYFPPSNYVREGVDIQAGSGGTVTHTLNISPLLSMSYYSVPLDVKLKCNDWVDCTDVSYYLVLETDFPFAFDYNSASEHGWAYSMNADLAPFKANFIALGYFTDP